MHLLASMRRWCKRSRPQECSQSRMSFETHSAPLKFLCWIPVHRHDFKLIENDHFEITCKSFDPLRIVMTHSDAFIQIENSIVSIFLFVARVADPISFVCL